MGKKPTKIIREEEENGDIMMGSKWTIDEFIRR
jgi:hypothetical protein